MAKKKTTLALVPNTSERKTCFKKRKKGLLKKVQELSVLCGVQACAIIDSPFDQEPVVWPSHEGVQEVLARFSRMPEFEQNRNILNQETFTQKRLEKTQEILQKMKTNNRTMEIAHIISNCLARESLNITDEWDQNDLSYLLNQNMMEISMRIDALKKESISQTSVVSEVLVGEGSNAKTIGSEVPTSVPKESMEIMPESDLEPALGWEEALLKFGSDCGNQGPTDP